MNALQLLPMALRGLAGQSRPRRLARILQVDDLAAIRLGPRFHYRPFTIAKRDGRERRVLAPSPALKTLQRRLLDDYLADLPIHPGATAFHAGASVAGNARVHARQQLVASVDLRDFFESTQAARVRRFFIRQGWRDDELQALMRLCVFRNGLPQGAPTSPCLSNLVNVALDERLAGLAQRSGGTYTRYGDDLTFSWASQVLPGGFTHAVEDALQAAGYEIQPRKSWRIQSIDEHPCVTGVVLRGQGKLAIPWSMRWRIWTLRWRSWWSNDAELLARLQGYQGYVRMLR